MARLDFAQGGLVPPHTHPRATKILFVVKGSLLVGFLNVGEGQAIAIAALNSQNPGVQAQAAALYGSGISDVVLERAFGLSEKAVDHIKSKFSP
ncbi:unnamed protein product [Sphagnum troendelagicum]|uniref:Cupin type-1 domain-containing protein n=1 Tax=Sphagnum troendelagicum TaxID=128251 RepID=A0ABP0TTH9_9BRYO